MVARRIGFGMLFLVLSVAFMMFAIPFEASAVPAAPVIHTLTQDDGTAFTARQWGDEWLNGWETEDGYAIVFDSNISKWTYAVHDSDGSLIPSSRIVGRDIPPSDIPRKLRPVGAALAEIGTIKSSRMPDVPPRVVPPTGTANIPVIMINFNNTSTTYTTGNFTSLLFGTGNNSMKDYYQEVSYSAFSISAGTAGVKGWYTAANGHDYYGYINGWQRAAQLAKEAVTAADSTVNFDNYDMDGDCYVDVADIIHQGAGAEAGLDYTNIWSHRWSFSSAGIGIYTTNDVCTSGSGNVKVNDYVIQPETLSGNMQTVGVFAHEYGHALGLPDLYDTDGSSEGIGNWSLMAGGSWNQVTRSGDRPAHMDAWCKYKLGWVTPTDITTTLTNEPIDAAADAADVYKLLSGAPLSGEYFLVENRYKTKFDAGLPASGLLIWHIDGNTIASKSGLNTVNTYECYPGGPSCATDHFGVKLVQADNLWDLEKGNDRGDTGDPYPGSTSNTSFTDSASPNSNLYDGSLSNVSITSISAAGATMTATLAITFIDISVSPIFYDFGNINVGSSSSAQPFIISNTGTDNLILGTITLAGIEASQFSLQNDLCSGQTIVPGFSCSIQAVFSPASIGSKNAYFSIPSNDPDTPVYDAQLSGVGIQSSYSSVTLLAPDGGEAISSGSSDPYTIKWGAPASAVTFKLQYSTDNGLTWKSAHTYLTYVTGDSYSWTVPIPNKNMKKCLVKVTGYNASNVKVGADKSDSVFTIEVVRLTSPNGGETLTSGGSHTVTWKTNATKTTVSKVQIYYTKNALAVPVTWKLIKTYNLTNPGWYSWRVPTVSSAKTKCKVKVVLKDWLGNSLGNDTSDAVFTIQP